MKRRAFLDLGSNLDREASLRRALELLSERFGPLRTSSVYESDPVGFTEQPAFYNQAVELSSELSAGELRVQLRAIEDEMGRVRTANKYGPRNIDLDLVLLEGVEAHPQVLTQAFVLVPLCELAPELVHPETGRTLAQEMEGMTVPPDLRRVDPPPPGPVP